MIKKSPQLLLTLALIFITIAIVTGVGALEYKFYLGSTFDKGNEDIYEEGISEWVEYNELSSQDKKYVERAIEGEQLNFDAEGKVPGFRESNTGKLAVSMDNTYYVFDRGLTFAWWSHSGIISLTLSLSSLYMVIHSIKNEKDYSYN